MASACIRSSVSNADLDEEVGKTRRAVFSTAKRSRVSEEFPFLALLVAVGVSDGGKPVIILQSEVSVLTLRAFPLDEKHKHLSLAPRTPAHGDRQLRCGGDQGEGVQHGLDFLPRERKDNPAW